MVDKFAELISFLGQNLIQGIFISVLLILSIRAAFKDKIEISLSAQIIRWIIVIYAFGAIVSTILLMAFEHSKEYAFLDRATGPYWWAYFLMLFSNSLLPLILLNKKIGEKLMVLLFIALVMNLGWLVESFVIHITSVHQDFSDETYNPYLPNTRETRILIRGFILGVLSLITGNVLKKWKLSQIDT